jgi:hypothetical protein
LDDNRAKLAAAARLLVEGELELLVSKQTLLDEQIAEANFLQPSHASSSNY